MAGNGIQLFLVLVWFGLVFFFSIIKTFYCRYDGDKDRMHVYSDLFVLNVEKLSWKQVVSPSGCDTRNRTLPALAPQRPPGACVGVFTTAA